MTAYANQNFKSKKDFADAVKKGEQVGCHQAGLGPNLSNFTGTVAISGPHSPEPHKWYAQATLENGIVKKVK